MQKRRREIKKMIQKRKKIKEMRQKRFLIFLLCGGLFLSLEVSAHGFPTGYSKESSDRSIQNVQDNSRNNDFGKRNTPSNSDASLRSGGFCPMCGDFYSGGECSDCGYGNGSGNGLGTNPAPVSDVLPVLLLFAVGYILVLSVRNKRFMRTKSIKH